MFNNKHFSPIFISHRGVGGEGDTGNGVTEGGVVVCACFTCLHRPCQPVNAICVCVSSKTSATMSPPIQNSHERPFACDYKCSSVFQRYLKANYRPNCAFVHNGTMTPHEAFCYCFYSANNEREFAAAAARSLPSIQTRREPLCARRDTLILRK